MFFATMYTYDLYSDIFILLSSLERFNSLPHDKILDWSKLKALADDKINVVQKLKKKVNWRVENILGKGENAGFKLEVVKIRDRVVKG